MGCGRSLVSRTLLLPTSIKPFLADHVAGQRFPWPSSAPPVLWNLAYQSQWWDQLTPRCRLAGDGGSWGMSDRLQLDDHEIPGEWCLPTSISNGSFLSAVEPTVSPGQPFICADGKQHAGHLILHCCEINEPPRCLHHHIALAWLPQDRQALILHCRPLYSSGRRRITTVPAVPITPDGALGGMAHPRAEPTGFSPPPPSNASNS